MPSWHLHLRGGHLAADLRDLRLALAIWALSSLDPVIQVLAQGIVIGLGGVQVFLRCIDVGLGVIEFFLEIADLLLLLFRGRSPVLRGREDHRGDPQEDQGEGHDDDHEDFTYKGHGPILPFKVRRPADHPRGVTAASQRRDGAWTVSVPEMRRVRFGRASRKVDNS